MNAIRKTLNSCLALFLVVAISPGPAQDKAPVSVQTRILAADAQKLLLELRFPEPSFVKSQDESGADYAAMIPGCYMSAKPGAPALPFFSVPLALPANVQPSVRILSIREEESQCPPVAPAPAVYRTEVQNARNHQNRRLHYVYEKDAAVYRANAFYPSSRITVGRVNRLRGVPVLPLKFYPLQYNPVAGKISYASQAVLQIDFPTPQAQNETVGALAVFDKVLRRTLLNYEQLQAWRTVSKKAIGKAPDYFLNEANEWLKIFVQQPGIYRIGREDLLAAGLNVDGIDPRKLRLFQNGEEVAIRVIGEQDGQFDDEDAIEFYGWRFKNYYTATNVYWLGVSDQLGKRMDEKESAPLPGLPQIRQSRRRLHIEADNFRRADFPGNTDNERWFMQRLYAPATVEYAMDLPAVVAGDGECTIVLRMQGITSNAANPDHHTAISINGVNVFDKMWEGRTSLLDSAVFAQALLHEGENSLHISAPGGANVLLDWQALDYFEIDYLQRNAAVNDSLFMRVRIDSAANIRVVGLGDAPVDIFDVSEKYETRIIKNALRDNGILQFSTRQPGDKAFLVVADIHKKTPAMMKYIPTGLRSAGNRADYLIITVDDFISTATPLAQFRETQDLSTKIIDVADIYDEFGYGFYGDRPIRDFLKYAYTHWAKPAPTFVLLIGDASWNPRRLSPEDVKYGGGERSDFVPTRLFEASVEHFEAASDNWFGCIDGEDDMLPDFLIGRLPVRSVQQLSSVIEKILKYETEYNGGNWSRTAAFVADAGEGGALAFEDSSDALIRNYIPGNFDAKRLYVSDLGMPETRDEIMNAFAGGALTMNYFGHGSVGNWSAQSIFVREDVPLLQENIYLPFVFTMSCINGYFIEPNDDYSALAEALLEAPGKGAVAVFSGSGEAYPSPLQPLARTLYSSLYDDFERVIGAITLNGLFDMYAAFSANADHVRFYILFGDPALNLHYYYEEDAPVYAGFQGRVTINSAPPDGEGEVLAFIDGINMNRSLTDAAGRFGPLYIPRDNPDTPVKDGGAPGDSVDFKFIQNGDTLALLPSAPWLKRQTQNLHLDVSMTAVAELDVQFYVDDNKVGEAFVDGDAIARQSTIYAAVDMPANRMTDYELALYLNDKFVDPLEYEISPSGRESGRLTIAYAIEDLTDGEYRLSLKIKSPAGAASLRKGLRFAIHSDLVLEQVVNFPNPFSDETSFTFIMLNDRPAFIKIKIYTVAGRLIRVLDNRTADVGYNEIDWDGRDAYGDKLANGLYFYKIIANDGEETTSVVERLVVMQ